MNATASANNDYFCFIAPVSMVFSFSLMCIVIVARKKLRVHNKRDHLSNILWMSICDFGWSLCTSLPLIPQFTSYIKAYQMICYITGIASVFFLTATTSWYVMITLSIYIAVRSKPTPEWLKARYSSHLYVWTLSLFSVSIPNNSYDINSMGICWIQSKSRFIFFSWIPLTIHLVFALALTLYMSNAMHSVLRSRQRTMFLWKTCIFVLVFVCTWIPIWIKFLLDFLSITLPQWLNTLSFFASSASGVSNFSVWIFLFPEIRNIIKRDWRRKRTIRNAHDGPQSLATPFLSPHETKLNSNGTEMSTHVFASKSVVTSDYTGTYEGPTSQPLTKSDFSTDSERQHIHTCTPYSMN